VLEASSELSPREYSAEQALGRPNVPQTGGDSPNAWMPFDGKKDEYVKVAFQDPLRIRQIAIAESFNPGSIYQVYMYDRADNEFLVNTFEPGPIGLNSRMQYIFMDLTEFEVAAVKVVLHPWTVSGYNAIDAIGVSNSALPMKQEVLIVESNIITAVPERLSENVNSVYNELRPLISPDGKTLYFSRQYHPENLGGVNDPEDIWYSELDEKTGEWKQAENIGAPLNNPGPNYISSITPDGGSVILTLGNEYKGEKMRAGVSYTNKTSQGWTEPKAFKIKNLINLSQKANFFLANNRKVLIMSIEGPDSRGDRDLYASFLQDDDKWSEPLNLGMDVNTAMEEASPFLAPDDVTLYFSSNGLSGFGKHDIYVTRRLDDTWINWSEPENLSWMTGFLIFPQPENTAIFPGT
jgi:hypothetical protein